ncbi:MAG: sugar transferase [Candidatus Eremiobacteraeota bacterium]|nr:sugar transferase [Candidatus Eremiobacteraeota bacterium]
MELIEALKSSQALPSRAPAQLLPRVVPASWRWIKRATDLSLGLFFLLLAAPVIAAAALAIMVVSPGAPFFVQERVGRLGRRFPLYKLRTMHCGAHLLHGDLRHLNEVDGPVFKIRKDPRLHALGAFLRKSSIDELPNFWNVLTGDMSIVGPRPPLASEVEHYSEYAVRRLTVKPGITCLWQIMGRSNLSFDEWMRLDNEYIDTWTPFGDLKIIARTIPTVLRREGAH